MPMRWIAYTAVLLCAFSMAPVAWADATVVTSRTTNDFTGDVIPCSTENIVFSGTATVTSVSVVTPQFVRVDTITFNLAGVTAVGETTGTAYRVTGVTTSSFSDAIFGKTKATTDTFVQTWQLVPLDGGRPLSFQEVLHLTFDPDDNLVILASKEPRDCL